MDTQTIIAIIKRRRDQFWDRQTVGSASDPDGGAATQRVRDLADEYEFPVSGNRRRKSKVNWHGAGERRGQR
jgi:hypothetical protein